MQSRHLMVAAGLILLTALVAAVALSSPSGPINSAAQTPEPSATPAESHVVPGLAKDGTGAPEPTPTPPATATPTPTPPSAAGFEVVYIDVGQGDATLVTVEGERLLIDGGRSQTRIETRLSTLGITDIDAIVSTHPDADHIAGLIRVLELYEVDRIYLSGGTSDSQTFADYMAAVNAEGATVSNASRGDTIPLGNLHLDVFHPDTITGDSNADSVVAQIGCGSVDVLLTGDATTASEASMLSAGVLEDIEVLKVGHHGSNTSTGQPFLDVVQPEYAVISAGMDSQYGHPHDEVVSRLQAIGAELYHTDTTEGDDTVTMTTDCESVTFDTPPWDPEVDITPTPTPTEEATATPAPSCVDINSASHEDLQDIVHIGPARATEIIDLRPFGSVDDLDRVSGIGPSRLQDIKDQGLACV